MTLAIAIVSAMVLSVQAQAPSSVLPRLTGLMGDVPSRVLLVFPDGTELRADRMERADPLGATTFRTGSDASGSFTVEMLEGGAWKPVPPPTEFVLTGNVRLKFKMP